MHHSATHYPALDASLGTYVRRWMRHSAPSVRR